MRDFFALSLVLLVAAAAVLGAGLTPEVGSGLGLFSAMAVVQLTYASRMPVALAGQVANMTNWDADTRICETAAGIGFGLACAQGTADKGAVLGGALPVFVGVSVRDITLIASTAALVDKYEDNHNMAVLNEGDIWVQTSVATSPTDPVHYDATTGIFAISGGTGPILGARYMESRVAGLGLLRLSGHLPVP